MGERDKRESGRKGGGRINKQDVTVGTQFQTRVVRDGGGKKTRRGDLNTYIDSFPGKLGTAMLGEGGEAREEGRREVQV